MASPAAPGGPTPVPDTTPVADGSHSGNNKGANERVQYQPNEYATQNYGYSDGMNGIGNGMGARQWGHDHSALGKLDGAQYMGGMNGGVGVGGVGGLDGYNQQDEANFVQSFAVQQPFLPYPYLPGFQPFGNQLYSQFGYGFGHPFADPNQFVDGGQAYFGMPDGAGGGGNATSEKNAVDGLQGGGEQQFFMDPLQLYQFGNTFANLSLQGPQDQRLFQQQLYQHQLLQLQQQHQQLQQQLLQTSHQLALQAGQQGVEHDQAHTPDQRHQTESQQPENQQEEGLIPTGEKSLKEETQADQEEEIQQTAQPPQKPKQEGPKSWADIINSAPTPKLPPQPAAKKQAFASTASPSPSTTSASSNSASANTAGAMVVKSRGGTQENNHRMDDAVKKVHDKLNPTNFDYNVSSARFFVIKSYSEDDIHKSIKYNVWASTDSGNRRLDTAYRESATSGPIYLFYSVNASGQFCGMARMTSALDYGKKCELWAQDKWNGQFTVHWLFIKDIPNAHLRHIRLMYLTQLHVPTIIDLVSNNENKPVTNSRDTQEIFFEPGREMLRLFTTYNSKTSILDDFSFYDKRQELMKEKKDLPEDAVTQKSDTSVGELLPIATGESRKQRGTTSTTKVTSPQTQSNYPPGGGSGPGSSPQPHAKGTTNGTTTTTTTSTTTTTTKAPQRGKR